MHSRVVGLRLEGNIVWCLIRIHSVGLRRITSVIRVAIMNWATLVNTQTHTLTDSFRPVIPLAQPDELKTAVHITKSAYPLTASGNIFATRPTWWYT